VYELDEAVDREWIRSLMAAGVDGIGEGEAVAGGAARTLGREQVLAAGRARLARRRLSAVVVLAVVTVLAAAGYLIGSAHAGSLGGRSEVTASTTSSAS
jgi:hypothetical protein